MNPYRSLDWHLFRESFLSYSGNSCSTCGRSADEDIILQVHHKKYINGRMPWEYSYEDCEALCKGCHAAEHGIIPPKHNWQLVGDDDLGSRIGTCDLCGTDIRYVYLITHPKWVAMEVGTDCCDNLTSSTLASNHRDSVKKYRKRKATFIDSDRWKVGDSGQLSILQRSIRVELIWRDNRFGIEMNGFKGRQTFDQILQAKEFVFDVVESGKAEEWLRKKVEELNKAESK